jgi:hypothetical protein
MGFFLYKIATNFYITPFTEMQNLENLENFKLFNPIPNLQIFYAGWSAIPDEKASRYRLSIKDIQNQDSGTYTCASPRGLTNSVSIIVAGNIILFFHSLFTLIFYI